MTLLKFWWCCFVSMLVRITFDFDPVDHATQRRELAMTRTENDRLRVAFVRAQDLIKRFKRDAITLPSMPAAEPTTRRSMRAAEPSGTEYLTVTPAGDGAKVSR